MEDNKNRLHFRHYVGSDESIRMMRESITGHHPAHTHDDFIEIVYVLSGRGEQTIDGVSEVIEKGDLYLFNASVSHSFTADAGAPLVVCNCLFIPSALGLSLADCRDFVDIAWRYLFYSPDSEGSHTRYIRLKGIYAGEIADTLGYMAKEYERREHGYMQVLRGELVKLMILLFRRHNQKTPQQTRMYYHRLVVEEALTYLKEHYSENISCEKLAERAYLSVNYFREIFRKIMGVTVIDALQKIRVEEACRLLWQSDMTISRIAEKVGYADIKFFYAVFKKEIGKTPGDYRKEKKINSNKMPPKNALKSPLPLG